MMPSLLLCDLVDNLLNARSFGRKSLLLTAYAVHKHVGILLYIRITYQFNVLFASKSSTANEN